MKKTKKPLLIIGIVILLAFAFILFNQPPQLVNGYWNNETQECWSSQTQPPGTPYISDNDNPIASCCFDLMGAQIDCNDPTNYLAVYGVGGQAGEPGKFGITHSIKITNDGAVPIDKIWIDSATWSPSNSVLSNAYSRIIGKTSSYSTNLPVGTSTDFPTDVIELRDIGGESGYSNTYNLAMTVKASAYSEELETSKDLTGSITVEKEEIGFGVVMGWGAGFYSSVFVPPQGLISHWKLDGDSTDSKGNNDGIISGAIYTEEGKVGGAYYFDSSVDRISFGNDISLNSLNSMSVSFQYKPSQNPTSYFAIIGSPNTCWDANCKYFLLHETNGKLSWTIVPEGAVNHINYYRLFESSQSIDLGEWNHIVATYNHLNGYMAIYVNGVETRYVTKTPVKIISLIQDINIRGVGGTGMTSLIDDIQLYDRALNANEVTYIYNEQK